MLQLNHSSGQRAVPTQQTHPAPNKVVRSDWETSRKVDCCVKSGAVPLRPGVVDGDGVKQHIHSP